MDSNSDSSLMLKVKAGDLDKLGLLFERYNRRLFKYFYRLTRRRDVSEDLVQGVFERIIKYRTTYTNDGAFSTWIFRIARNLHADYYRSNEQLPKDELADFELLKDESYETMLELDKQHELRLLNIALNRLDSDKKETLILSRYQGFRYTEIAEIMGCSVSAVKVRIFRAINELKEIVSDQKKKEEL